MKATAGRDVSVLNPGSSVSRRTLLYDYHYRQDPSPGVGDAIREDLGDFRFVVNVVQHHRHPRGTLR